MHAYRPDPRASGLRCCACSAVLRGICARALPHSARWRRRHWSAVCRCAAAERGRRSARTSARISGTPPVITRMSTTRRCPPATSLRCTSRSCGGGVFEDPPLGRALEVIPVVIAEGVARRFWPGEEPLGRQFRLYPDRVHEVVGVARETRHHSLAQVAEALLYVQLRSASGLTVPASRRRRLRTRWSCARRLEQT